MAAREVTLGRVRGVFGVHGWVRVESFTALPLNILNYAPWQVHTSAGVQLLMPLQGHFHGPGLVVQLGTQDGGVITDRDVAQRLVNADIRVARESLPPAAADEVYLADLLGMQVVGADGHRFGPVTDLLDNGAQTVLKVGEEQLLVPFVRDAIIASADVTTGEIHLTWSREDLLD